jgi:hypothetical protein
MFHVKHSREVDSFRMFHVKHCREASSSFSDAEFAEHDIENILDINAPGDASKTPGCKSNVLSRQLGFSGV